MSRVVVGPFNRVEGDLEVTLDVRDGYVHQAWVNSPLYRGFERVLLGREPLDALVFAPRICGICSVSQSVAAASALADLAGAQMPRNGALIRNLIHAAENLADHFTHFYLFFMPDFAREDYADRTWHSAVQTRFRAVRGQAPAQALPARARFLTLMGLLAGKWPHTLAIHPGGASRAVEPAERLRLLAIVREFRTWLERHLFGDRLECVLALESPAALEAWRARPGPAQGDFAGFLRLADDLDLVSLGRSPGGFLSYGSYPIGDETAFAPGQWVDGQVQPLNTEAIDEDLTSAWLSGPGKPAHPLHGVTEPVVQKADAYSWCKAPRMGGAVVETGALARQLVDGQPLIRALVAESGGNVRNRVIARLIELARVPPLMEHWVRSLQPGEPCYADYTLPGEGVGVGLTEAARGSLGHWLTVRNGMISNYQIIAPTTWNFSPRDHAGVPGPLEQALVGTPAADAGESVAVQHVVRSFDPCMVCTVH
ncbi:nickel-dependent hydrogenase large subunit [Alkalilimnicola ehrlichii MLHE-1]|uniref:Nickel-dependent hydrogenase, large subunit n=1 Tax=Alkalilimnicola ehrlichii (strain ATCC BAA-1101 / DSM 17681 / MLHE-1) TaxID=187272 RepID=Q0A735_ALKEH|nr:nickel-dependent hydrogenase large subunit [Alkalilimnicola ehrlichii]ABI57352.1 nickel-dependent hydrogenase, large subunit [Alkalilimnicola ehrlichii MLHE-1]